MRLESIPVQPLVTLILGILILLLPQLLNYLVAAYLIFLGLTGLLPYFRRARPDDWRAKDVTS